MKIRLGDRLERLIEATVPNAVINEVKKEKDEGCGCAKRQAALNNMI